MHAIIYPARCCVISLMKVKYERKVQDCNEILVAITVDLFIATSEIYRGLIHKLEFGRMLHLGYISECTYIL